MRISDWSSDVCSSDLEQRGAPALPGDKTRAGYRRSARPSCAARHRHSAECVRHFSAGVTVDYQTRETKMSTPLFKILIFLKRRSGMSSIAFRDYYEGVHRSEERRVGKECERTCSTRGF